MNYFDADPLGLEYLPRPRGLLEFSRAAGLPRSKSPGLCANTKPRAETSRVYRRHETSSVCRHRWSAKGTDVLGSRLPLIYLATL
jgi:hypothetical protein